MAFDYRQMLDVARAQLADLQAKKDQIGEQQRGLALKEQALDREINAVAQMVSALAPLVPDPPPDFSLAAILELIGQGIVEGSIASRIRSILQSKSTPLSAIEIRAELQASGFYLGNYSNALSTIHTTLRRLVDAGELEELVGPEGKQFRKKADGGYTHGVSTHPRVLKKRRYLKPTRNDSPNHDQKSGVPVPNSPINK